MRATNPRKTMKCGIYHTRVLVAVYSFFMKTIKQIKVKIKYLKFIPEISEMEENTIYISLRYLTSSHLCLCGCKNEVVLPIGKNGWSCSFNPKNPYLITFTPSILNSHCPKKYHYVITENVANVFFS